MNDINTTIEAGCIEIVRSLDALGEKHGHKKATVAMLLHNSGVLLCMMKRHEVDDALIGLVKYQFASLANALCGAAGLDVAGITKIAEGIDEQCAMLSVDVIEAEKQTTDGEPTTKEQ